MMKHIGNLLLTISLAIGALSAATSYMAPLDLPDDRLLDKTINGPAGLVVSADGEHLPFVRAAQAGEEPVKITPELLKTLRDHRLATNSERGIARIQLKEFSLGTWREKTWFGLAVVGLVVGATLVKTANRREIAEAGADAAAGGTRATPEQVLARIRDVVTALRQSLPAMRTDEDRNETIIDRIGLIQREMIDQFVETKNTIQARGGLTGVAMVMDRFASMERQLNRAWSAAADGATFESLSCLERAEELIGEVEMRLRERR